ncbi:alpha/beta hydrolase [Eleftheria terrae]|uniref:alpha/beta hydrolase n=1 Tax=Eleftheria terrae TaxID=1597781 RepID=UPI00263BC331|nr:alpha/beta hydrolase [Eleftheria terrae]WKB54452.1 alpha/beta hydrolase [Eleftheria terrae]
MNRLTSSAACRGALVAALLALAWQAGSAGTLRERWAERLAARGQAEMLEADAAASAALDLPRGVRLVADLAYGLQAEQRFDVYRPLRARSAPVIFMVHGGGWKRGDKAHATFVQNKVQRWTELGFVVISTNYRLLPGTPPDEQARDVARAVALAQRRAEEWGGDRNKFILLGHSAGAHLVGMLASSPALAQRHGVNAWLGSVLLDSAALDVVTLMQGPHFPLHDDAFGADPAYWPGVSPYHLLQQKAAPLLMVCSIPRQTSCDEARRFAARASLLGSVAEVEPEALSHREINELLGLEPGYTGRVERFLATLDPVVAHLLGR